MGVCVCVCVEAMLDLPALHMCIEEDISLGLLTVKPLSPLKWIVGHRYDIALKRCPLSLILCCIGS